MMKANASLTPCPVVPSMLVCRAFAVTSKDMETSVEAALRILCTSSACTLLFVYIGGTALKNVGR